MYAILCGEGARQLIWILDVVQEYRDLCQSEFQLKSDLKNWFFFGLTTIEKLRAKQQSRLMTIKAAEASLRLFFMQVNDSRKNFIQQLELVQK